MPPVLAQVVVALFELTAVSGVVFAVLFVPSAIVRIGPKDTGRLVGAANRFANVAAGCSIEGEHE